MSPVRQSLSARFHASSAPRRQHRFECAHAACPSHCGCAFGAAPGESVTKCIKVSYTGSLKSDVDLYTDDTAMGPLAQYVDLTITQRTQAQLDVPDLHGIHGSLHHRTSRWSPVQRDPAGVLERTQQTTPTGSRPTRSAKRPAGLRAPRSSTNSRSPSTPPRRSPPSRRPPASTDSSGRPTASRHPGRLNPEPEGPRSNGGPSPAQPTQARRQQADPGAILGLG